MISYFLLSLRCAQQKCSQHCEKRPYCQSGRAVRRAGGAEGGAGGGEAVQEQGGRQSQGAGRRTQEVKIPRFCVFFK